MKCPECGKVMVRRFIEGVYSRWYENPKVAGQPWYWWCGCGKTVERCREAGMGDDECRKAWEQENAALVGTKPSSHKTTIEKHQAFPHEIVQQIIRALEYWRDQDRGLTESTKALVYEFYGKIYGWRY